MSLQERLAGRTAVVTGAAGDIGRAIATRFEAEGARVASLDLAFDGPSAGHPFVCDITDEEAVARTVGEVVARLGPPTILVNNAAAPTPVGTVCDISRQAWDLSLAVNLTGAFLMCRSAIPVMAGAGGGVIINVASQLGHVSTPGRAAYCATKAALHSLTRTLALDHAGDNIRAVSLSPGAVRTGRLVRQAGTEAAVLEAFVPNHPIGRIGEPEEIAAAAAFLASEEAGFMTGTDMLVDGGYTAR
ncbi:MAG: SDR family oxidoreductase [Pseudomonadota bacterium]